MPSPAHAEQSSAKFRRNRIDHEGNEKEKAGPSTPQLICKQINWLGRDDSLKITLSSRMEHNDSLANRYAQSRDLLFGCR